MNQGDQIPELRVTPDRFLTVRYAGASALVGLLAAFGQLHGSLIKQQRLSAAAGELLTPDWTLAEGSRFA